MSSHKSELSELRKLSGLVSLTDRPDWNLKESNLTEADKIQIVRTRLMAHVQSMQTMLRELGTKCGSPMEFYSISGGMLEGFSAMLKSIGDADLAEPLHKVSEKLTILSEANRFTNNWNAVPTDESVPAPKPEDRMVEAGPSPFRDDMVTGMARAMFVCAWADAEEEGGTTYREQDLMKLAPTTSPAAKQHAEKLAKQFEQMNKSSLDALLTQACEADGSKPDSEMAEEFGHYLAMQAMGHGVSWFDDHEKFPLKVPHTEFYL